MSVKIRNSLTRKTEDFVCAKSPDVRMYTCGVTVYDECHIGHARSLYVFDVIRRYLAYRKFNVHFVRNITDIDDKIINRANELNVGWKELVEKYIVRYYQDLESLGIGRADAEPRATENIPQIIAYIRALIEKGFAYPSGGDVYFSVRKFSSYGKLSGQAIEEMQEGARIDPSDNKKDPLDFALWKKSREGEPSWPSPWGDGRPGWHIECSVMSQGSLETETLDIHAGGRDLIFPHHENEIAQAEARTGKPFARYWIHHGLLTINGQKMSKSLGNFITIKDILKKYEPNILKLFFLSVHYRSPIDFTYEGMEETKKAFAKIQEFLDRAWGEYEAPPLRVNVGIVQEYEDRFCEAMDDDFNTAQGRAVIFDLVSLGNKFLASQDREGVVLVRDKLLEWGKVMGLRFEHSEKTLKVTQEQRIRLSDAVSTSLSNDKIKELLLERQEARKNKNFKRADEIREFLKKQGISIDDTKSIE